MPGPLLQRTGRDALGPGQDPGHEAIALVEVRSIARGILLSDAVVKRAAVTLCLVRPVSPGKHLTLFRGGVGEVEESFGVALQVAGEALCDRLFLPQAHDEVLGALRHGGRRAEAETDALGIVETFSAAAALLGADGACKAAAVRLHTLRLCDGLGGKAYFVLTGPQEDVEAALGAAERLLTPGLLMARELIPRPHEDLLRALRDDT